MNSACRLSIAALMALISTQGIRVFAAQQAPASQPLHSPTQNAQILISQADSVEAEQETEAFEEEDLENTISDLLGVGDDRLLVKADESIGYVTLTETSTISLEGGEIAHAEFRDNSTVEMTGSSHISHANLLGAARITMKGTADVSHLTLSGSSTAEISENTEISHLNLRDNAEGNIAGGTFGFINLSGQSVAHIRELKVDGGALSAGEVNVSGGAITYEAGTTIHIYGQALRFEEGTISGNWAEGTPFTLTLISAVGDLEEDGSFEIPTSLPNEVVFHEM